MRAGLFVAFVFVACGGSTAASPLPIADLDASIGPTNDGGLPVRDAATGSTNLRVVAANISSGPALDYAAPEGARIFKGLAPDVVLIQEFNVASNAQSDFDGFVSTTFGASFSYYREPTVRIPNGIISRYPILESGHWVDANVNDRSFVYAKIAVPGPKPLWAVSLHLLTTGSGARNAQAMALVTEVKRVVPEGDYLVIGGDFNTNGRQESCITTLSQIVVTTSAVPDDGAGNDNTNAPRNKPHDWVLADTDLAPLQAATVLGTRSFAAGLVFDSRVYAPLTDVAPVLAADSAAQNMQHMPIVKDYRLP